MTKKYINEKEFCDFKTNFHTLINVFNHNITDMKDDAKETKDQVTIIATLLAKMEGNMSVISKIVWWILGIIATLIAAAVFANGVA